MPPNDLGLSGGAGGTPGPAPRTSPTYPHPSSLASRHVRCNPLLDGFVHAATRGERSSGRTGSCPRRASAPFKADRSNRDGDGISMPIGRPSAAKSTIKPPWTPSTGHLLGADFLISSNNFHESCSRFQAPIRRSSSTSDVPTHSLSLYRSELRAKLRIDRTPEALL